MTSASANDSQTMLRYVTIRKFSQESGYSENAVRSKIAAGVWLQDIVWVKAPDGRILIDIDGYQAWVLGLQLTALQKINQ